MDKLGWDVARSRTKLRWNWSVRGVSNPVKGWALTRKSAMRQVEEMLRIYTLMIAIADNF